MSAKIVYKDYNQNESLLFPPTLGELVPENHPVRIVNAVIDRLDISSIESTYKGGGTSSFHPRMLLKVIVYSYLCNVYSGRRMERLGLMTDAGRAVLPDMTDRGFVIDDDVMKELKSDPVVWQNFCRLPELYKRVRIDTIQIKKRQPELFRKRLDKFIENTRKGVIYGEWNDNGRLLV